MFPVMNIDLLQGRSKDGSLLIDKQAGGKSIREYYMNKELVFLFVCCIVIWFLAAFFVACMIHAEYLDRSASVVTAIPEQRGLCIDVDIIHGARCLQGLSDHPDRQTWS
jgi:hypothetical protein